MRRFLKTVTVLLSVATLCVIAFSVFGTGTRTAQTPVITAFALPDGGTNPEPAAEAALPPPALSEQEQEHLLPYLQTQSMFSDIDTQYAFLIIAQSLDRSFLKNNATLSLENGNEFVVRCWSSGMGLEITEALAGNRIRLDAWENAVDVLWEMDAFLSRDIKETLGTDKSVTFLIMDDVRPEAVLLKIKDGCVEYNLFRDGTSPKYEVYRGY